MVSERQNLPSKYEIHFSSNTGKLKIFEGISLSSDFPGFISSTGLTPKQLTIIGYYPVIV